MTALIMDFWRMAWPTDWHSVFGRQAPLVLEIGFGNGKFLAELAQTRPDLNLLGIEIAMPSLNRTANRVRSAELDNVRLIRASAQAVVQTLCRSGSVDGVTINFPDPWPKAGHTDRRLISTTFLELLASRMVEGADLDIATDHAEYGAWIADHLRQSPHFHSRLDQAYTHQDPDRLRTKYEQKGLAAGSQCLYFKWRRNNVATVDGYPVTQELPMPHVIMRSSLSLQEIAEAFEQRECKTESTSVRFVDVYLSQGRPALVVDTYIAEQPFAQRLMIEIYRRPDGDYVLRLLATGFPRATAGVHKAIECLVVWLCEIDGEATILRHNLRSLEIAERDA
jgi:tRNA (guanine-N7-)-methyltransferase